jgi:membrane protein
MTRKPSILLKWLKQILKDLRILWRAFIKFYDDNGFFLASGITFNALTYLIPFIMLLLGLLGAYLYNDQEVLVHIRRYFKSVSPSLDPRIMESLFDIIQNRQIVGILGFAGLLWVSTLVFGSLRTALNIVFRVKKGRTMLRGTGVDLLMILLVGILLLLSMILTSVISFIQGYQSLLPVNIGPTFQWILKYPVPFFLTFCMFFLIYRIIPNQEIHSKPALQGALIAGLLWELAKHLFGWYVAHVTRYRLLYGSLSTLVIFVFWAYYSAAILLIGGEFVCLLEQDRGGSIAGEKKERDGSP